jgi:hypothetical protein
MGLVNKLLKSFTDYIWEEVLLLPPEYDLIQKQMQATDQQLALSKILLQSKRESSKLKKDAHNESKTPPMKKNTRELKKKNQKLKQKKPSCARKSKGRESI